MGTVRVRNSIGYVHDIDERIFTAFPDDYALVEAPTSPTSASGTAATAAPATGGTTQEGAR